MIKDKEQAETEEEEKLREKEQRGNKMKWHDGKRTLCIILFYIYVLLFCPIRQILFFSCPHRSQGSTTEQQPLSLLGIGGYKHKSASLPPTVLLLFLLS